MEQSQVLVAPEILLRTVAEIAPEQRHLLMMAARTLAQLYPARQGRETGPKLRLV